ncbi:helix-turn-helix transcriptional regulator [Diaphorobacter aerolatus]|uniref:Helix-turn-helix transcriptional regulator n=2 Tax=Diaphorobacter aerolatus TaxID=1288495 RepID=A0A7H0GQS0_9BURK|nr:helix-turn-helix transcriptional regulator [Diaphorobacter aerolatus]
MTQEDMAIKLDCGVEAVSRLERGTVLSTIPRLIEIAEVLGVPFNELIGVSSDIPSDQALHITRMLEKLNPSDRLLVLGFVEQLVKRLSS